MKAAPTKTTSRMKATATMETAATATMETAATTAPVETAATTAPATARLRCICERQRHDCAREDRGERQPNLFAAPSSQHIFLHPN
jgi:hypothetical protein